MKKLIVLLPILVTVSLFAQTPLLSCKELKPKLLQIKNSYKKFASWKKQNIKYDKWSTDFSICGVKGIVEIYEEEVELTFNFTEKSLGPDGKLEPVITRLRALISEIYDSHLEDFYETEGDDYMNDYSTYTWRHLGIGDQSKEVDIKYPGIDDYVEIELTFRYRKDEE